MDEAALEQVLRRVADASATHDEVLKVAQWAVQDQARMERLRADWPTDQFPVIGDYFCFATLGVGAAGAVFKALWLRPQPRLVALKLLHFTSEDAEARFRDREVEILRGLDCPHVARYLDSGKTGGTTYLAMQLVEGQPLNSYLAEHTATLEEKLAVFRRVCEVVAGLHDAGVIHRDLKPKHILVDRHGQPWIVDFGLSAAQGEDWPTLVQRSRTELGHILGTVRYMSPEQAWGGLVQVDHRADIWALGIMLYEIATDGDYPYDLGPMDDLAGHEALLHRIQSEAPAPPRIRSPEFAEPLKTLIDRCLAFEPHRRLGSAAELALDLGRCLVRQSIQTRRLPWIYRLQRIAIGLALRSRAAIWLATVAGTLLLILFLVLVLGVRAPVTDKDFGRDTRKLLADAAKGDFTSRVTVVGIVDSSLDAVPEWAGNNGFGGVSRDLRTWRPLYAHLMERLAAVHPRAVVYDCYFRSAQPDDSRFVQGVQALRARGVPVVLGVVEYRSSGRPALSHDLYGPIAEDVRCGMIAAQNMVERPGSFVMALKRGDLVHPGITLAVASVLLYPDCKLDVDWQLSTRTIRLIHYPRTAGAEAPAVDPVKLTTEVLVREADRGFKPGDVVGCKAFPLGSLEKWEERTVPLEQVLAADDKELRALFAARVFLLGDLRTDPRADRHDVLIAGEITRKVPGCYLVAEGVCSLLKNQYYRTAVLPPNTYGIILASAIAGCLLAPRLAARSWSSSRRMRRWVLLATMGMAAAALLSIVVQHRGFPSWSLLHTALGALAFGLSLTVSLSVEFARVRYRRRTGGRAQGPAVRHGVPERA